jgi:uncharacterized protein YkwD
MGRIGSGGGLHRERRHLIPKAEALAMMPATVISTINLYRSQTGCAPVVESAALQTGAQAWADQMLASGVMSHGDFVGRVASFHLKSEGECVAEDQQSVEAVVDAWESDEAHRRIITGDFDEVGIGIATAPEGHIFWCADFGRSAAGA